MRRVSAKPKKPKQPINRRRAIVHELDKKDPTKKHRWVNQKKVDERREDYNYTEVMRPEGGPYRSGGDVLMACPRNEWVEREEDRKQEARDILRGPIEAFRMQGLKHGVETIDQTKEKIGPMSDVLGGRRGTEAEN